MAFTKVATVGEVPAETVRQVTVGKRKIALVHSNGAYYALDDTCPHRGAPLSEGEVLGNEVVCPWHAARFDVATGAHLCPPARSGVTAYKVQIVGEDIQVDVPA